MTVAPRIWFSKINISPKEKFSEICNFKLVFLPYFEKQGVTLQECTLAKDANAVQGVTVEFLSDIPEKQFWRDFQEAEIVKLLKLWQKSSVFNGRRIKYRYSLGAFGSSDRVSPALNVKDEQGGGIDDDPIKMPRAVHKIFEKIDLSEYQLAEDFDRYYFAERTAYMSPDECKATLVAAWFRAKRNGHSAIQMKDVVGVIDERQNRDSDTDLNYIQRLSERFVVENPRQEFDSLILPVESKEKIRIALSLSDPSCLKRFKEWGLDKIEAHPRAVLNFYGPSGTGKTFAAMAIANYLGKKIIIAGVSELKCKWIGESAKNIRAAFYAAEKHDAVLFFDEADGLVSQRSAEGDSVTSESNSMRNEILVNLETHSGVVIFATNFIENYDPAMETRMQSILFAAPNEEMLKQLWSTKLAKTKIPGREEIDIDQLASWSFSKGFCGRDVKNTIVNASKTVLLGGANKLTQDDLFVAAEELLAERKKMHSEAVNVKNTIKLEDDPEQDSRDIQSASESIITRVKDSFFKEIPFAADFDFYEFLADTIGMTDREVFRVIQLSCLIARRERIEFVTNKIVKAVVSQTKNREKDFTQEEALSAAISEISNQNN